MVVSATALAIISYSAMLIACVLFIAALVKFYNAGKTKLKSDYSKAFRFSGNGFLVLGLLQVLLLGFMDSGTKVNATYAAGFFILFGAVASFVGEKLKPKMHGRK